MSYNDRYCCSVSTVCAPESCQQYDTTSFLPGPRKCRLSKKQDMDKLANLYLPGDSIMPNSTYFTYSLYSIQMPLGQEETRTILLVGEGGANKLCLFSRRFLARTCPANQRCGAGSISLCGLSVSVNSASLARIVRVKPQEILIDRIKL